MQPLNYTKETKLNNLVSKHETENYNAFHFDYFMSTERRHLSPKHTTHSIPANGNTINGRKGTHG